MARLLLSRDGVEDLVPAPRPVVEEDGREVVVVVSGDIIPQEPNVDIRYLVHDKVELAVMFYVFFVSDEPARVVVVYGRCSGWAKEIYLEPRAVGG